uniref:Uncharacterized protein n=1 Tax=Amphimedon queenslandica TaxID=400682 RepID=A0A1X7VJ45_AMPQE
MWHYSSHHHIFGLLKGQEICKSKFPRLKNIKENHNPKKVNTTNSLFYISIFMTIITAVQLLKKIYLLILAILISELIKAATIFVSNGVNFQSALVTS